MHLCVAGWLKDQKVGYVTQFPSPKCGDNHVGVVLYKDPVDVSSKYDAYCYRVQGRTAQTASSQTLHLYCSPKTSFFVTMFIWICSFRVWVEKTNTLC